MTDPIYTEITSCRDCYKCVRQCPVKAIQIRDGNAFILKERCMYCGKCVAVCPNGAKKVRNDVDRVKHLLSSERRAICSLAPSYVSEFRGRENELLAALKRLGFDAVSETAIGASLVSEALDIYMEEHGGSAPFISTACPAIVELVKKYYPEKVPMLSPVPSPLQSHSAYLRHLYGEDILIVFIGPCIAKKMEADLTPGYPDAALTFDELRSWLEEENISLDDIKVDTPMEFVPSRAGISALYPIEGGQIETSSLWQKERIKKGAVALSGMEEVLSALSEGNNESSAFLELLSCEGGCINGPSARSLSSIASRKLQVTEHTLERLDSDDAFKGDRSFSKRLLEEGYSMLKGFSPHSEDQFKRTFDESAIRKAMIELGKMSKADELNCGGCGYSTCRDMAIAYLSGMAEPEMCVTKMRKEAESKVDVLLRTMPNGIVIVDSDLLIVDCNTQFLSLFGDMEEGFVDQNVLEMVKGIPVERFVPFEDKFKDQFYLHKPGTYRMHYKDKFLRVTFFLVEQNRLLGAMFEDITNPTVKRETVVKKAEDVIQKSLETVQQIASLLGENAAETEIMLNSLIDAFSVHQDKDAKDGFVDDDGGDLA